MQFNKYANTPYKEEAEMVQKILGKSDLSKKRKRNIGVLENGERTSLMYPKNVSELLDQSNSPIVDEDQEHFYYYRQYSSSAVAGKLVRHSERSPCTFNILPWV